MNKKIINASLLSAARRSGKIKNKISKSLFEGRMCAIFLFIIQNYDNNLAQYPIHTFLGFLSLCFFETLVLLTSGYMSGYGYFYPNFDLSGIDKFSIRHSFQDPLRPL